jgi:hypothetical protein
MPEKIAGPPSNVDRCRKYRARKEGCLPAVEYTTDMSKIEKALRM